MGTLRKSHEEKEVSSGEAKDWEKFRTNVNNDLEDKEMQWIICGTQAIAKHFQSIVAGRTTDKSLQGTPMQTDLTTFPDKQIKKVTVVIAKMDAQVALDLVLVKNKKDVIDSSWAEHDKLKITEEQFATCHESIDQSYIVKVNRTVLRMLHNAIYRNGQGNTRANQRLQHILDTAEIRKMITGENSGDQVNWKKKIYDQTSGDPRCRQGRVV